MEKFIAAALFVATPVATRPRPSNPRLDPAVREMVESLKIYPELTIEEIFLNKKLRFCRDRTPRSLVVHNGRKQLC